MLYSLCSMQFCINKSNLVCAHLCFAFILKIPEPPTSGCGSYKEICQKLSNLFK